MKIYEVCFRFAGKQYKAKVTAESAILARDKVRNSIMFESVKPIEQERDTYIFDSDILGFLKGFRH
jgi:hypothetical protein